MWDPVQNNRDEMLMLTGKNTIKTTVVKKEDEYSNFLYI